MSTGAPLNFTFPASGVHDWDPSYQTLITAINSLLATHASAITALQVGGATGPVGPQGPVPLVFASAWSPSVAYVAGTTTTPGNWVTFNGGSYYCIASNTNRQPDLNPNSWAVMALPGAAGPAGPTGPAGPQGSGGGQSVSFPITVVEGGTGAITAPAALTNLGAAASGVNNDITRLLALVAPSPISGNNPAINVVSAGPGQAILFTDGTLSGGITTSGDGFLRSLSMAGNLLCGGGQFSGGVTVDQINSATGTQVAFSAKTRHGLGLIVVGTAPVAATGELGLGSTTSTTATAGSIGPPSLVEGYLLWNVNGVNIKIPFYGV